MSEKNYEPRAKREEKKCAWRAKKIFPRNLIALSFLNHLENLSELVKVMEAEVEFANKFAFGVNSGREVTAWTSQQDMQTMQKKNQVLGPRKEKRAQIAHKPMDALAWETLGKMQVPFEKKYRCGHSSKKFKLWIASMFIIWRALTCDESLNQPLGGNGPKKWVDKKWGTIFKKKQTKKDVSKWLVEKVPLFYPGGQQPMAIEQHISSASLEEVVNFGFDENSTQVESKLSLKISRNPMGSISSGLLKGGRFCKNMDGLHFFFSTHETPNFTNNSSWKGFSF